MAHVTDSLSAYLDDELAAQAKQEVEAHLRDCSSCRAALDELKKISHLLSALPRKPLPTGFMQRLGRQRDQPVERRSRPYWLPFPARMAAFALSSLIISLVIYDKARFMFPVSNMPRVGEDRLRLSTDDLELARASRGNRPWEKAKGEPLVTDASPRIKEEASANVTNEQLQADIERQKKSMGIRAIVAPRSPEAKAFDELRAAAVDQERLSAAAAPAPPRLDESSATPKLLAEASSDGAAIAAGASEAPPAATSEPPAPKVAEGVVLASDEERQALWAARGFILAPPSVNYNRNVLVLVIAPDMKHALEILSVQTQSQQILVRYRLFPRLEALASMNKRIGNPVPSYQFRVVPKTEKLFTFERVE